MTAVLNNNHSSSTPVVYSGSSRNKDDALSAQVFLTVVSPRLSTLFSRVS